MESPISLLPETPMQSSKENLVEDSEPLSPSAVKGAKPALERPDSAKGPFSCHKTAANAVGGQHVSLDFKAISMEDCL